MILNNTLNAMKLRMDALMRDESLLEKHAIPTAKRSIVESTTLPRQWLAFANWAGVPGNPRSNPRNCQEVITLKNLVDLARTSVEGRASARGRIDQN